MQVKIGERHEVERNTNISMCQQLQQTTSLSDDELEYAADSAASPLAGSPADEGTDANGAAPKQHGAPTADGHGEARNPECCLCRGFLCDLPCLFVRDGRIVSHLSAGHPRTLLQAKARWSGGQAVFVPLSAAVGCRE